MAKSIMIEVSGGAVAEVTSNFDSRGIDVIVVDWDNINVGDKGADIIKPVCNPDKLLKTLAKVNE